MRQHPSLRFLAVAAIVVAVFSFIIIGGVEHHQQVDALAVTANIAGNYSSTFLGVNETICASHYLGNMKAVFGIVQGAGLTQGLLVEVDLKTMSKTRTFSNFTKTNPCAITSDDANIYFGTNTNPAEVVFLRQSDFSRFHLTSYINNPRETNILSTAICTRQPDTTQYVYFGPSGSTGTAPRIIRAKRDGTGTANTYSLNNGYYNIKAMFLVSRYMFMLTDWNNARKHKIIKFDTYTMNQVTAVNYWNNDYVGASAYTDGVYGHFSMISSKGVLRYNLRTMSYDNFVGMPCGAPSANIAYNGRYAYQGLAANTYVGSCAVGIGSQNPSYLENEITRLTDSNLFDASFQLVTATMVDDTGLAYYSFQNSDLTSFVLTTPQRITGFNSFTYQKVQDILGYSYEVQQTMESYDKATARCASKISDFDGVTAATLATPSTQDRQNALWYSAGDTNRVWLSASRRWNSGDSRYYFSWGKASGTSPSSTAVSDWVNYRWSGSGYNSMTCVGRNYCGKMQSDISAEFGECLTQVRNSGEIQNYPCNFNESAAVCEWAAPNVSSMNLVHSGIQDRFFTLFPPVARGTAAGVIPPAIDFHTNKRYEWNTGPNYFEVYPFPHSTEISDFIDFKDCTTPTGAQVLASALLFITCSDGNLYEITLATKVVQRLGSYGSFNAHAPIQLNKDFEVVIIHGSQRTDIFSFDKNTNLRALAWTYSSNCRAVVLSKEHPTYNTISAWCGNWLPVATKFFQDPATGRFTTYAPFTQPSTFTPPSLKAFSATNTDPKLPAAATVITMYDAIPEIPVAFESPTFGSTACGYICKDLTGMSTTSCSTSLVTASANVTAALIGKSNLYNIELISTTQLAQITCTGGTTWTNTNRQVSLHDYLVTRQGMDEKNKTGLRHQYRSNPVWGSSNVIVDKVMGFPSKTDPNLIGFVADFKNGLCANQNRPESWWNEYDHLYPNFLFRRNPTHSEFNEPNSNCEMTIVFYYNISANSKTTSVAWMASFAGSFTNMPHSIGAQTMSDFIDGLFSSHVTLVQKKPAVAAPSASMFDQNTPFFLNDFSPVLFFHNAGLANKTLSKTTFSVVTDQYVHVLKRTEPGVAGVVDEYTLALETADFAETMHVLRCGSPASGKFHFKTDKSSPKYGNIGTGDMPPITLTAFEPSLGAGGFYDKNTNKFAITNVPCPPDSNSNNGGITATRIDLVITFTADATQPLRVPFIVLPHGAPVPSEYPFLPMTTATTTQVAQVTGSNTVPPIISLPEYASTTGNAAAIAGFPSAATIDAAADLLKAAPAGTYTVQYQLKDAALGKIQFNKTSLAPVFMAGVDGAATSAAFDSVSVWGTNQGVLANAMKAGLASLITTPDADALNLVTKRYLQITVTGPTVGSTSVLTLPLNVLKKNTGPTVINAAQCQNVAVPQGAIWFNYTFGKFFHHPENMQLNLTWRALGMTPPHRIPDTVRLWCLPNLTCSGQGTYNSGALLRIEFNATDGIKSASTICSLKPYWVELHESPAVAMKPISPVTVKAERPFQYFIPLDLFESSAPEIRYTQVLNPLIPTNVVFDNPNILRGAIPSLGTFSFIIVASDLFTTKTTVVTITAVNVGPVVGDIVPLPPLVPLKSFNLSLPIPCTDPDGDGILVTMTTPPPTDWTTFTLSPGKETTQAQQLFISGTPPVGALGQSYTFELQCADHFASVTYNQTMTVLSSEPPQLVKKLPNISATMGEEQVVIFNAWEFFQDPDKGEFSVSVDVPAELSSWVEATVATPKGAIDHTKSDQNNEIVRIKTSPKYDCDLTKCNVAHETEYFITIWAVDKFGMTSKVHKIKITQLWTQWMLAAPVVIPIVLTAAALTFIGLLVCFYPCFWNHCWRRRSVLLTECPMSSTNPRYKFPADTARVDISVRRTGCVWPIWIFSNYMYDRWTLKPTPIHKPPRWLEVTDDYCEWIRQDKSWQVAGTTKEVVVRCFAGSGLLLVQFDANYDTIASAKGKLDLPEMPMGGAGAGAGGAQEMNSMPLLGRQDIVMSPANAASSPPPPPATAPAAPAVTAPPLPLSGVPLQQAPDAAAAVRPPPPPQEDDDFDF